LVCDSCGALSSATARFCSQCGAPQQKSSRSAEYKQVTVLFADVVHSMEIAAAVGPERLREIMVEVAGRCASVVQRLGCTLDNFTGDGIMAVFGAPTALEDHAVRGCLAALAIQDEVKRLAVKVLDRDGVKLQLRVGLNSGQVIAGDIGTGLFGYTAIGEQVGMAQRMESVAPPGGVMLSFSTARLVDAVAALGERESVQIKGAAQPVAAYRLLGMRQDRHTRGAEPALVGRQQEINAIEGLLNRALDGHGAVVGVTGPPGIGKSRLVREISATATSRGADIFVSFCESHANQVPFHAVARLLRAATRVEGLDAQAARDLLRARVSGADPEDLLLFYDLLGVAHPDVALPKIDPDARRRRLTALVNAATVARANPAVYVIEDVHWIDAVSESMLADFLTVVPETSALMIVTYRPEYRGALTQVPGARTVTLSPLTQSETASLVSQLLGSDASVSALGRTIAERAAGTPFFAEEMVRELTDRGVLKGTHGAYTLTVETADVTVPATLQATIAARIDRLDPQAKRTLSAAAVIGSRFDDDLLAVLDIDMTFDELVKAELIDQVRFAPAAEYAFRHPLIRAVAYESQLKSDRADMHGRIAAAIERLWPDSVDENAALIAEHVEAAGDLVAAYGWHMRAGGWSTTRDIGAARLNWERARRIADALPADYQWRTAMRIAPRTLLCGTAWRVHAEVSGRAFEELRDLCTMAGDKASLAMGMAGLVMEHWTHARMREASELASELMGLVESIGDAALTVGLSFMAILMKAETGALADALRWSQTSIELAGGDPTKGNFIFGSPLAVALATRGVGRWCLGQPGWREDFDRAIATARGTDPISQAYVVDYIYGPGITAGVVLADDAALNQIDEALQIAERSADDFALGNARLAMGLALMHRESPTERERGLELLAKVRAMCLNGQFTMTEVPIVEAYTAREQARSGNYDAALAVMRPAVDELLRTGLLSWCVMATGLFVETLLARNAAGDLQAAKTAVERMAAVPSDDEFVGRQIWLLRLRAQLAAADGDEPTYRHYRDGYRAMADALGFQGHKQWSAQMV
jgi:class 3 adenylate cyclase